MIESDQVIYSRFFVLAFFMKPLIFLQCLKKKAASLKLWREYKTPEGRPYYYNVETKETTWICPKDFEPSNKGLRFLQYYIIK